PFLNVGERLVIVKYSGESRYLYLSSGRGILSVATPGSVRGHNATRTPNSFTVAATRVSSPAQPFVGGSSNPVEFFSSDGPRRMFFNPNGTAITPGNYTNTGGVLVPKPDLTAADGVSTSVPGFNPFLGTSAAAPHAAAIAALLWSYSPLLTPATVRSILTGTALDTEGSGFDRTSGAGIVMAYPSLAITPQVALQTVQLLDANGDGNLDASECANLVITLQNPGTNLPLTGVTAVLTSSTSGVFVDPAPQTFSDLQFGNSATSTVPFHISTTPGFICGSNASFNLLVTSAGLTFALP